MRIPGLDRSLISALVLGLTSGGLAAQTVPGAATRLLPGSMSMGRADAGATVEQRVDLEAYDSRTTFVVELSLPDLSAVEAAAVLGLADARLGLAEYTLPRELLDLLLRAGFDLRVLGGVTTHRFALDGARDLPPTGPDTPETAQRAATVLATPGSFYIGSGTVNDPIPDNGWAWRWLQVAAGSAAPSGSVTTNLKYRLRIHNDSDPGSFYCGDYEIYLSSEAQGGAAPIHLIYNNLGSATDGGFDDDVADDSDIYLNLRETGFFNDEDPNQQWYVYVIDNLSGDSGLLQYIEFDVYWDAPDTLDLIATDITSRDQPEQGGVEVTDPLPGQELYPHFYFTVESASELTGKIYAIDLSGTPLCSYTGPLGAGNWVAWCTSPWTATAGDYDLRGLVDPDDTFAESNETNNEVIRHYTIGSGCSPDAYEPDDSSGQAGTLTAGASQTHSICPAGDEDWATFTLGATSGIVVETAGASGDTRMWLYDSGLSEIEYDDDDGSGAFSMIARECGPDELAAGTYYVQVDEFGDNGTIDDYTLSLTVTGCGGAPDIRVEPLTLDFDNTAPPLTGPTTAADPALVAELSASAQLHGKVRVIVGLDVSWIAESQLPDSVAVTRQRGRIAATQETVLNKLRGFDVGVLARYRFINFMALEVDAEALAALAALAEITSIEEDVAVPPAMASSNPVIGSPAAWAAGYEGQGQVVAVLDTGVDKTHPFFSTGGNKVVSEACYSTTSVPDDISSVCPGGVSSSTAPGSGVNCSTTITACHHGTHVAGSVAGNDGSGPNFGVAREAELIAVQVFSRFDDDADCGGPGSAPCVLSFTSDQILGLERVYALRTTFNIASANMSLGGGRYFSTSACDANNVSHKAAIDNLRGAGIATVASSGNDGFRDSMGAPGCISTAVSVGATTDADVVASFSNVASFLDLLAPGVSITSSAAGGGTLTWNGTSMATPHVAGAWAILKQVSSAATVDEVLTALRDTGTSIDDIRSGGTVTDLRRINVDLAIAALQPGASEVFTIYNDGSGTLSVTSMDLDAPASWISWSPSAPFDVATGGSRQVAVLVDFDQAPSGFSTRRLVIGSNDADEDPYPGGVFINVDTTPSACYALTLGHTGSGADPTPAPANSPGCPASEYHAGELVNLTAVPDPGWAVSGWAGTNNDSSTSTVNAVTMPAAAHPAEVHYIVAPCFDLTLSHTGMGADPTPSPANSPACAAGEYHATDVVSLTAAPDPGWAVDGWTGTDDDSSTSTANTVTLPASAHSASVIYAEAPVGFLAKLTPSDGGSNGLGAAVSVSGDTVVLGPLFGGSAVYVYERDHGGSGNWGEVKKLTPLAGLGTSSFGESVAISGDTIAIGAQEGDDESGAVYIFERNEGGAGNWGEAKTIQAPEAAEGDSFGVSVAIDGDRLAVGAMTDGGSQEGAAWIFERDQGGSENWGMVKKVIPSVQVPLDKSGFGASVATEGDLLLVYENHDSSIGPAGSSSVYVFERDHGGLDNWGEVKRFIGSQYWHEYFGEALAISGDTVAIGARGDDDNGTNSGAVFVYERDQGGLGNWGFVRKVLGQGNNTDMGTSVALFSDLLVAGAPDRLRGTPGSARVFVRHLGGADNWGELSTLLAGDGSIGDTFGAAVGIDSATIVVGAPWNGAFGHGAAYLFGQPPPLACFALSLAHTGLGTDPAASPVGAVGCDAGSFYQTEVVTLTAAPDLGWWVSSWAGTDDDARTSTVNTVTMAAADHAASVAYTEIPCFSLTLGHTGSGTDPSPSPSNSPTCPQGEYYPNERVSLTALPDSGWGVTGWSGTNNDSARKTDNHLNMPAANHVASVTYGADLCFGLTFGHSGSGADPSPEFDNSPGCISGEHYAAALVGLTAAPDPRWVVASWAGTDDDSSTSPENTVTMPAAAHAATVAYTEATGSFVGKLSPSDPGPFSFFGISVAISGDTAVVGAHQARPPSVDVYERNQGGPDRWGLVKNLVPTEPITDGPFGWAVAISGDTIAVGGRSDSLDEPGAVYIFERNHGGPGNWSEVTKIQAPEDPERDFFGESVALDGDTLAVGAPLDENARGAAWIFERDQGGPGNWGMVRKMTSSDPFPPGLFGFSLALEGDLMVVEKKSDPNFGFVGDIYFYERNQGGADNWGLVKKKVGSAAVSETGSRLAVSGDTMAIGDRTDSEAGVDAGAVNVYRRNVGGVNNWGRVRRLLGAGANSRLGASVALSEDVLVAGATDSSDTTPGLARVFSRDLGGADNWGVLDTLLPYDGAAGDNFGRAASVDGFTVVVGAPFKNFEFGSAYVFEFEPPSACFTLTLTHTGSGSNPAPSPIASTGCIAGSFHDGEVVTLTAAPEPNWLVTGWAGTDNDSSTSTVNTVTMPAAAHAASVAYAAIPCYSLTLGHSGSGADPSPEPSNSEWCAAGEYHATTVVTLTAAPDPGWDISGWAGTDNNASTSTVNTVTMPATDHSASVAYAEIPCYSLMLSHTGSGADLSAAPSNSPHCALSEYHEGEVVTLTADPDPYWRVAGWAGTDNDSSPSKGNTVTMPASAHAASVTYAPWPCYRLTLGHSGSGADPSPSPNGSPHCAPGEYHAGELVTLTADPDPGWAVDGWTGTYDDASPAFVNSLPMVGTHSASVIYVEAPTGFVGKLIPSAPGEWTHFGDPIGVSGDTVVVGAPETGGPGVAYVYERDHGGPYQWGEVKKLVPSDGTEGAGVAISGDTIVIGAHRFWSSGDPGVVYVFERDHGGPGNWGEAKKIEAPEAPDGDSFGGWVAIDGNRLAVGAWTDGASRQGAAWIFERDQGGPGNWGMVRKVTPSDQSLGVKKYFGWRVALEGDLMVVSELYNSSTGDAGSAYIFERNQGGANNWGEVAKKVGDNANDRFGGSVAVSGDTVAIGSYADDDTGSNAGSVSIYRRNTGGVGNWGLVRKLQGDGDDSLLGFSATLVSDFLVAGAPHTSGSALGPGVAQVFVRDLGGADNWGELDRLFAYDGIDGDRFGQAAAMDGATIVIGSMQPLVDHADGAAYVFELQPTSTCYALTLAHTGSGSDPTSSPVASPGCEAGSFYQGEVVTLTAAPDLGWEVSGWTGSDNDSSNSTVNAVTMPAVDHAASVAYVETSVMPDHLHIHDVIISSSHTYEACLSITVGPNVELATGGLVIFRSPLTVLDSPFSVGPGEDFRIENAEPAPCGG